MHTYRYRNTYTYYIYITFRNSLICHIVQVMQPPNISPRFHITPGFISSCPVAPLRRSALLVELPHALRHLLRTQRGKLLHQLGKAAEARQMRKPGGFRTRGLE